MNYNNVKPTTSHISTVQRDHTGRQDARWVVKDIRTCRLTTISAMQPVTAAAVNSGSTQMQFLPIHVSKVSYNQENKNEHKP